MVGMGVRELLELELVVRGRCGLRGGSESLLIAAGTSSRGRGEATRGTATCLRASDVHARPKATGSDGDSTGGDADDAQGLTETRGARGREGEGDKNKEDDGARACTVLGDGDGSTRK